ncbi:hypothetical protein ACMHYO_16270 [Allopusillimonas ginsengisoli]|uniref:hypothetical protein n=1 Tax=Allopusillimonas ginsengisoli TaxID=453575 RepID=UPI0039C1CAD0
MPTGQVHDQKANVVSRFERDAAFIKAAFLWVLMMKEIEQILNNNLGNRLTQELVIGLVGMLSHYVGQMVDEGVERALALEGEEGQTRKDENNASKR